MAGIFISYRRYDSAVYARLLYDRLNQHFGEDQVFIDIKIEPGLDFVTVIAEEVGSCNALVAVIGRRWLTIADANGKRRLDNPKDFVRLEIATALQRKIRVIPVLVGDATPPGEEDLPTPLKKLAYLNALTISDAHFDADVGQLIETLEKVLPPPPFSIEPEMICVPEDEFLMGSKRRHKYAQNNEEPQHTLNLPTYYIARMPVTNAQYGAFIQATKHNPPSHWQGRYRHAPKGKESHPVVYVSWYDAVDYCNWLSGKTDKPFRLPSEAEWEKAARGTKGLIYPWGNWWSKQRCNSGEDDWDDTTPVESYPRGASHYGLLGMAGNVWEWTLSLWGENPLEPSFDYPYNPEDGREDLEAGDEVRRVLRGGSYADRAGDVRCAVRRGHLPYRPFRTVGFRVAASQL